MESRISRIFLKVTACLMLVGSGVSVAAGKVEQLGAAPIIEPFVVRTDLDESDINTENFEVGAYIGQISMEEVGTSVLFGVSATFHATEDLFIEANYAVTTMDQPNNPLTRQDPFTDDAVTMYNLSLGLNVLPGEVFVGKKWAFNSALYVIGGAGITEFNGDDEFTVNVGLGYRIILTDWMAFHIDFRDHIFSRTVLGTESKSQNFDFHSGVTFFF